MTRYAITGASGYVGTRLSRWLLAHEPDAQLIGFDVRPPQADVAGHARFTFHRLDVRDPLLGERLREAHVDALLHFAFVVDPLYDENEMTDIDVGGTRNVLAAVLNAGVNYLLCTSSTTAYGACPDNPVPLREENVTRASRRFVYAHDKRQMDELVRAFAADHPAVATCIVRPCIVLGPNVANYIAATLLRLPFGVLFDGNDPPGQFIHEDDLVQLIVNCLQKRATGAFNAVGRGLVSSRELASAQGKRTLRLSSQAGPSDSPGWRGATRLTTYASPPGMIDFLKWPWAAAGEKAERELGFVPRYSSAECFAILVARRGEVLESFARKMKELGKR